MPKIPPVPRDLTDEVAFRLWLQQVRDKLNKRDEVTAERAELAKRVEKLEP